MGTDRYAYLSRLRRVEPMAKMALSAVATVVCLCCGGWLAGLVTMFVMGAFTVGLGGVRPRVLLHFMKVPLAFLLVGCITIVIGSHAPEEPVLAGIPVGSRVWGVSTASLLRGAGILCKAMGVIASMYFLALNTPMTDLTLAMRRLHVPQLLVELMELIYRFIFVLSEAAGRIRTAQDSRLGYVGFRRSMESAGTLASMVFLRAWRKGDRVYAALESRGYTGSLRTLADKYESGVRLYVLAPAVALIQLGAYWMEVRILL